MNYTTVACREDLGNDFSIRSFGLPHLKANSRPTIQLNKRELVVPCRKFGGKNKPQDGMGWAGEIKTFLTLLAIERPSRLPDQSDAVHGRATSITFGP